MSFCYVYIDIKERMFYTLNIKSLLVRFVIIVGGFFVYSFYEACGIMEKTSKWRDQYGTEENIFL